MSDPVTGGAPAVPAAGAAPAATPPATSAPAAAATADATATAAAAAAAATAVALTPPSNLVAGAIAATPPVDPAAKVDPPAEGVDPNGPKVDEPKKDEKTGEDVKPIEYTDFKLPEGAVADEKLLTSFKEMAAAAALPQETAQQLLDMHVAALQQGTEASYKLWYDTQREWQDQVKSDPEIGGKNLEDTLTNIARALDVVGGKEATAIRQAFDMTGAGNNPEIVRFLARLGKSIGEGTSTTGGAPAASGQQKTAAETLYGSNNQNQ